MGVGPLDNIFNSAGNMIGHKMHKKRRIIQGMAAEKLKSKTGG
jgi:hypothetical protein